jgi:aspartyl-tRNA(Asn)/glutamyl-tRNA(Gln) amidotransferase subunit A
VIDTDTLTLTGAWAALRSGELSAVDLFRSMVERYTETEPELHAWVAFDIDQAAAQAVVADRRLRASPNPPPLLGIPVGIKDIFDVAGKATRCNSRLREDVAVAPRDAETVHRLRKAGAVLMGKTVTQEFAAGVVSAPSRNPWDTDRVPGGSSGGSAVAVAAGTALAALGSDTGGSIRIPAAVTGTVGLKPTWGRIPMTGAFPLSPSLDTAGPIALTVADAAVVWQVLANRLGDVPGTIEALAGAEPSLAGTRIGVPETYFTERLQPGVEAAFTASLELLRELGAELVAVRWEDARAAHAAAMLISRVESASLHHDALRTRPELFGEDVRDRFEVGALLSGDVYLRARRARVAVRDSIAAVYRQFRLDALVAPSTPATAPLAERLEAEYPDGSIEGVGPALTRLTMPWNATGQPVVSVPCGFDGGGMPVGLSFVGRPDEELALCAIAHAYEQAAGWFRQRPARAGSTRIHGED